VLLVNITGCTAEEQLAPGDVVVAVGGISTAGMNLRAVLKLLDTEQRPLTIYFGKRVLD
jgi:C-terminal processing protease CtpA/Prc